MMRGYEHMEWSRLLGRKGVVRGRGQIVGPNRSG